MKKAKLFLLFSLFAYVISAQEYDPKKLEIVAKIWGECYLFHPSVVRADREVNWERQLIEFLPILKQVSTTEEIIEGVNSKLLSALQDPFTLVQPNQNSGRKVNTDLAGSNTFDYLIVSEAILSDFSSLLYLDSIIEDKTSTKPLVLDCRINSKLQIDWHAYSPFHYFVAMLIDQEIPLSQKITREHFGWDEYNDWWFYEQRWKITQEDKQQNKNGALLPLKAYEISLNQKLPNLNSCAFLPIKRPLYIIVNRSFLSYYHSVLHALNNSRSNTFIIFENSGKVFADYQALKEYPFQDYNFILNTSFYINNGSADLDFRLVAPAISSRHINDLIISKSFQKGIKSSFSFQICPRKYQSISKELSVEEKILGIIKIWTIVKYFYPYVENCSVDWNNALGTYLSLAQLTHSDKDYYLLIQEMMAALNDSHVSTFHPSILDFSKIFVAPVRFEWIENKVIVTAIDSSVKADIHVSDEIVSINGITIDTLLKKEAKRISASNRQGLLATIINSGYFIGAQGSIMEFGINNKGKLKTIKIPRTSYYFHFSSFGDNRPSSAIMSNNIAYLNLAALTNTSTLENEMLKMKDSNSLIIDLRNSYPVADYQMFLQMLCQSTVNIRQSEVPVISASPVKIWHYETSQLSPVSSFSYLKPIVVIIDKTMISRPEDVAIALKSFPNVLFVGEQTQGTDGELSHINLPGGGETSFTGQIIKFGNGDTFQGTGIIPDIEVQRTIGGIGRNEDEILEKAIEILETN